jgi:hypothetical protein
MPFDTDQPGEPSCVILIAFVHTYRLRCMRMSRVDTNNWQVNTTKLVPKPARHGAGLEADALSA